MINHQGVLAQLANVIAATGANIHSISTEEKDARVYQVNLLITTKSRVHLANIMRKIRVMPDRITSYNVCYTKLLRKVALTRFDDRIRVAGTAELAGFDAAIPQARQDTITMVLRDLFPEGGDFSQANVITSYSIHYTKLYDVHVGLGAGVLDILQIADELAAVHTHRHGSDQELEGIDLERPLAAHPAQGRNNFV